jgi:hypothetical protein
LRRVSGVHTEIGQFKRHFADRLEVAQ